MTQRVLKRPYGGWGARQWRGEVRGWLWLAGLYLVAGASCATLYSFIGFVAIAANP